MHSEDWFEKCLDKYPDLPSVVVIRSLELKHFPREFVKEPVLDLCCGDGFFTNCLGLHGVCGCDIDERAVEQASRVAHTYARVCRCDARDLKKFRSAEFNTVFSNCALEHVDGVDRALTSIRRVLKNGGHLIMTVPDENLNVWFFPKVLFTTIGFSEYGRRLCEEYNQKQAHLNIHSLATWKKKLDDSGLTVEKSFSLFTEKEYRLVTFFESFVLDSFPAPFFRIISWIFRNGIPIRRRKDIWRKVLKKIYLNSEPRASGGELFIVAQKK